MSANARPSTALLGADAGGSHSTVVIGTADLTILGRADGPGSAMKPGGAAASAVVLAETARRAASQAGIHLPVGRAVVGAAGAGPAPGQRGAAAAPVPTRPAPPGGGPARPGDAPPPPLPPRAGLN